MRKKRSAGYWLARFGLAVLFLAGAVAYGGQDVAKTIPDLPWQKRSDWIDVTTAVTPAAKGDGIADDTAALQKAWDGVKDGTVIYLPVGTYRITGTLHLTRDHVVGYWFIGHGRSTTIVWDGAPGGEMLVESGLTMSRYRGVVFDGRGKATIGLHHKGDGRGAFETEVGHRDLAFLNFTDTGILADVQPATAEVMIENCLFDHCRRGIAFLTFNQYDYTIDGCEFRNCETAVDCLHGNTYVRNCRFEGSTGTDIRLNPEHGCSVRRCVSSGSRRFIQHGNPVAPLTIQDCQVAGWTNPEGAISLGGWINPTGGAMNPVNGPVALFDCVFTKPPGRTPPVQIRAEQQRLFVSQNISAATDGVYTPKIGKVYEIPAGQRRGALTSTEPHFLCATAPVPTALFDAKRDFGAKGDGTIDDTDAVQKTIDAARTHGKGAIAYLPTGRYVITKALRVTGKEYTIGGSGFRTGLHWKGPAEGTIVEVVDPGNVTLENINIGSHDVAMGMTNACDVAQTSTGDAPSFMTYDNVTVYGMYQRNPFHKGLWLRGLSRNSTVRVRHVEGNIHLVDAARATVLLGNSYEGSVVVEGKAKQRDGFLGILTRLGTSCTHALYVKDNHSLVASDFYIEQADHAFSLEGSPDDPPGRLTLQDPKVHMSKMKDGTENMAFDIRGYHGQIACGPVQFYLEPKQMRLLQTGTLPLEMVFWANSFFDTKLAAQQTATARLWLVGCLGVSAELSDVPVADTLPPEALAKLVPALDDLRTLGELDLRLNHPGVVK